MDEIWENIHLISSLHRPKATVPTNSSTSYHLQDFLPILKKVNPPPPSSPSFTFIDNDIVGIANTFLKSPCTTSAITALNLNVTKKSKSKKALRSNCNYIQEQQQLQQQQQQLQQQQQKVKLVPCVTCSTSTSNSNNNSNNNKRLGEEIEIDENSGEGRFKRMIKNRETAARSRDKKHAYTIELELELTRLKKENAVLRKQQYMLRLPAHSPPTQIPKKPTLYRTLTAPF